MNCRDCKSFDRNGMETCGLKSSFSSSRNLCQQFYMKQEQCSAKPCWYEASITQFNGKAGCSSFFVFFRLSFLSSSLYCFFFTYNSSVGDHNCCGVDWIGPQACVLDCCHQSGKYLFRLCPLQMLYYKVNRCLARYSPRHNHQTTHQQGTK